MAIKQILINVSKWPKTLVTRLPQNISSNCHIISPTEP
jgi:hypothetical protein